MTAYSQRLNAIKEEYQKRIETLQQRREVSLMEGEYFSSLSEKYDKEIDALLEECDAKVTAMAKEHNEPQCSCTDPIHPWNDPACPIHGEAEADALSHEYQEHEKDIRAIRPGL